MLWPKSAAMEHCHAFDTFWTSLLLIWKIGMAGDNPMTTVFNLKVCLTDRVMQWYIWQIGLCNGMFDISCYAVVCDRLLCRGLTDHVMHWHVWLTMLCNGMFDWSCYVMACLTDHVMLWHVWPVMSCCGLFDPSCHAVVGLDSAGAAHVTDQQAVLSVPLPECQGVPVWQLDREGVLEWQLDWEGELNYTGSAWMATRQGVLEWWLDTEGVLNYTGSAWMEARQGVLEWQLDKECLNDD